ncbi:leucyl aminopeptidase [Kytococcus aerolatus]|uniref:Probable cytosol aminopeptidase n=1 Tax=Kytococcus aerolatus TaxID=592308 RepID=A0A212T430_9MICO|nr:leucyl aminopeptidase [Kytococcus aerolatus]SNC60803.1 leucyl aminopeptidase [Kytococcus aerolatus]
MSNAPFELNPFDLELTAAGASPAEVEAKALVLGAWTVDGRAQLADVELPAEATEAITAALTTLKATGKQDSTTVLAGAAGVKAPLVVVAGLGEQGAAASTTNERIRRAAGAAVRAAAGAESVALALPAADTDAAVAAAEGAVLGVYADTRFKSTIGADDEVEAEAPEARRLLVCAPAGEGLEQGLARALVLGRQMAYTRDLVNTPANLLYPESFVASVQAHAPEGVEIEVIDDEQLREMGAGAIYGVGMGSARKPRVAVLRYRGKGGKHLSMVGKGITFDTGGISLKPAQGMTTMKCDMGGAAAVAGAVFAAAELGLENAVTGYLALAENMPSANAQRPGDVVTALNGLTVEVLNTDAEGRLAMCDALVMASRENPDVLVDIATLTGAAVMALGDRTIGVMSNDDELRAAVAGTSERTGEPIVGMPIPEEVPEQLVSPVADLKNITGYGKPCGMQSAAAYLQRFVGAVGGEDHVTGDAEQIMWAHLDIAGPAFHEGSPWGYTPAGGTGSGVRTLLALAEELPLA